MTWAPVIAWAVALVFGLVVLGFCSYEVHWKAARLRRDLARLLALDVPLQALRADLLAAQQRAATVVPTHVSATSDEG